MKILAQQANTAPSYDVVFMSSAFDCSQMATVSPNCPSMNPLFSSASWSNFCSAGMYLTRTATGYVFSGVITILRLRSLLFLVSLLVSCLSTDWPHFMGCHFLVWVEADTLGACTPFFNVNRTHTVEDLTGHYLIKSENRELLQNKICCKIPVRISNQECDPISMISESDSFDQQSIISVQGLPDLKHVHNFRQMLHLKYSRLDCGTLTVYIHLLKRCLWNKLLDHVGFTLLQIAGNTRLNG